jgi:adenylate cyclase
MAADQINATVDWLVDGARSAAEPAGMLCQLCERLVAAGLPLWRVGLFIGTLHPDIYGRAFIWRHGQSVAVNEADFATADTEEFRTSPLTAVLQSGKPVRHRLSEAPPNILLDGMRAEGVTDYIALPLIFTDGSIHVASWTTKRAAGFSDEDVAALKRIAPSLARVAEVRALQRTATTLLDTYVGNRAGARILAGQIRRGHTDLLHAAIWLSDLRGFTALSDRAPPIIIVDLLNRYFDCQVPAIRAAGGEVLKFMGDGLLAIFPIADDGHDERAVCTHALEAARAARAAVASLTYSTFGGPTEHVSFGLALHVGNVLYGNIGGSNRLDFTCIGPAVNLAARMEKLTGGLGREVVASVEFARHTPGCWEDIGEFSIAGLARTQRVFGLKDDAPRATPG